MLLKSTFKQESSSLPFQSYSSIQLFWDGTIDSTSLTRALLPSRTLLYDNSKSSYTDLQAMTRLMCHSFGFEVVHSRYWLLLLHIRYLWANMQVFCMWLHHVEFLLRSTCKCFKLPIIFLQFHRALQDIFEFLGILWWLNSYGPSVHLPNLKSSNQEQLEKSPLKYRNTPKFSMRRKC